MKKYITFILLFVCLNAFGQDGVHYLSPVDSANRSFEFTANFRAAQFHFIANFDSAKFHSIANFEGAMFHSTAKFLRAQFDSEVQFFDTKFHSTAAFDNATFDSTAEFYSAEFFSAAVFSGVKFHAKGSFGYVKFDSTAEFGGAEFYSTNDFEGAEFKLKAVFSSVKFHSTAVFYDAKFHSTAFFYSIEFFSPADFMNTKFHSIAGFGWAEFDSIADFRYAQFHSTTFFYNAQFHSTANFRDAQFHSTTYFDGAEFKSGTDFNNTLLPDTLGFSRVIKIKDEIDFTAAILDSAKKFKNKEYKCQINLVGSDLNKIKINYELFHLYFPKGTRNEEIISTYEKLRQRFKDLGFLESYKALDIEYQDYKNRESGHQQDLLLNWFQKTWWNYGYNKEQVIFWAVKFLCFFTLINIFLFEFLQSKVYSINFKFYDKEEFITLKEKSKLDRQKRKNIFFSSIMFLKMGWNYFLFKIINPLVYTMILFFVLKISIENFKKFSGWVLYIWLIYIAGVFCLAYIFNIIIVK